MIQSGTNSSRFCLERKSYLRIGILGSLLCSGFLVCAVISVLLSARLLSTYSHAFTPYLKWQDALAVLPTILAIALSVAGLAITLPVLSFVVIGLIGSVSFYRNMGALHCYRLTNQANLSINGFVLTIICPDAPEVMLDLNLLKADDQRYFLHLLHERWIEAQRSWNPELGAEIEVALEEAERPTV